MPSGTGHATHSFVWTDWANDTGYSSNAFVFLAGMLNGAYAVGTPDCVSHLAEEIPDPKRNIPLAIGAQMSIGFITAFAYTIAICKLYVLFLLHPSTNLSLQLSFLVGDTNSPLVYATTDLDTVLAAPFFPLTQIYLQATGTTAGTTGLLFVIFFPIFCTLIGTYITAGRCLWTLARDEAVPYSHWLHVIHPRHKNPFNATIACGVWSTILGAIYVGSSTAFNAFVGSFVVLLTLSYLASILPFIFTGRFSRSAQAAGPYNNRMVPGWFQMNHVVGYIVNIISCLYIMVFIVIYCFPYAIPVDAVNMNYSCLISGALSIAAGIWWLVKGGSYIGPQAGIHGQPEPDSDSGREMLNVVSVGDVDGLRKGLKTGPN